MAEEKSNQLFQIINALFSDKDYISSLTYETARQNIFMVLRRIAIKYPEHANVFNDYRINPLDAIKFWSDYLYNGTGIPNWMRIKGAVKSTEKKNSKKNISNADIKFYLKNKNMSMKDFNDYMRFFPEYITQEVIDYRELSKGN